MTNRNDVQVRPLPTDVARFSAVKGKTLSEEDALEQLKYAWKRNPSGEPDHNGTCNREILIVDLNGFEFFGSAGSKHEYEFTSLHVISPKATNLSMTGFISYQNTRLHIQNVPVLSYSIEGYNDADHPAITIFVQTKQASTDRTYDIWYRLSNKPTTGYQRFHKAFVWIATLGKHFVDYLDSRSDLTVGLRDFEDRFYMWLKVRSKHGAHFKAWHKKFGKSDYRGQINAYIGFLFDQAYNLPNREMLLQHPVFADCMLGDRLSVKKQPTECDKTITTPFVYQYFKDMYFGEYLEKMSPVKTVREEQDQHKQSLGFPIELDASLQHRTSQARRHIPATFNVGDVVGVPPDTHGPWKTTEIWLAYVQKIVPIGNGVQRLYVLWLYHPSDTIIGKSPYTIHKEYFLSDVCNDGIEDAILTNIEVVRTYSVDWCPKDLNTSRDILIRQKYSSHDNSFATLQPSDLTCGCDKPPPIKQYQPGDTVYIKTEDRWSKEHESNILEPVVITKIKSNNVVAVRRLQQLKRDCLGVSGNTRRQCDIYENELVWTTEFEDVCTTRLEHKCHILYLSKEDVLSGNIPMPYNRRGNGNFWFLSTRLIKTDGGKPRIAFLASTPTPLNQGPDPYSKPSSEKLVGLSIFSGSGNFDRGLEEGGAVEFHTAVDFSPEAIHTQKANTQHPESLNLFCGSVDDYLKAVLTGKRLQPIARIGEVLFIAGGSPCPGFSALQLDHFSEKSCRNASHITTICSYVDIYRPQYAIFENVVGMSVPRKGQNVLSNVVACFVAMGYQAWCAIVDAWTFGSPQRRDRLCLAIAAPGLEPISLPMQTHSHPKEIMGRRLGRLRSGLGFGDREEPDVPFHFTTAKEATLHLPDIGTGSVKACIPFPDHRIASPLSIGDKVIARHIPTHPPGQGYAEALERNLIPQTARKNMREVGKSFRRIKPHGLFPTITTTLCPQNSRTSGVMHYEQHRPITIQEAREAQGFPDNEVIIGTPAQQLVQAGNAVDRQVALACGIALYQAWEKSSAARQRPFSAHSIHALFSDKKQDSSTKVSLVDQALSNSARFVKRSLPSKIWRNFVEGKSKQSQPTLAAAPEPSGPSVPIERPRDYLLKTKRPILAKEGLKPRKRAKRSELHMESRSTTETTVTRHREVTNGYTRSFFSEKVTIRSELSISKSEAVSGSESSRPVSTVETSAAQRRTRHSGHQVEYMPIDWSKVPGKGMKR